MAMKGKRVLVAPLDWGLGHATRCIPLIQDLLDDEAEVILGCTSITRPILAEVFPQLLQCTLMDNSIRYSAGEDQVWNLVLQAPRLWLLMKKERRLVSRICKEQEIDIIISDNRLGCRAKNVHNILMTHQVYLKASKFEKIFRKRFHKIIQQFDELWIPDHKNSPGLAGELSHGTPVKIKTKYIGALSRFTNTSAPIRKNTLIAVLSGPEPQRSIFERRLLLQMENIELECTLIRGLPNSRNSLVSHKVNVIDHIPSDRLAEQMAQSEFIVCRSGYSTIMDLNALDRSAILIPTPGQSEQEYLAKLHSSSMMISEQNKFDLERLIKNIRDDVRNNNIALSAKSLIDESVLTVQPD